MAYCAKCNRNSSGGSPVNPVDPSQSASIESASTTEVRSWTALPLLDVSDVPEDLDLICGSNEKYQSWRIPASYFLPGGTMNNNQYKIRGDVEIDARLVTPVRILNDSVTPVVAAKADDASTMATAIAVSYKEDADGGLGTVTLMNSGFYTFSRPHMYEVGKTYYLSQSEEGSVISVRPSAGLIQPLFTVVDRTTISINIQLY